MKRSVRQCIQHLQEVLTPAELEGSELSHGGSHFKLRLPALRHTVTIPGSPSDRMWFQAWKTQVRRALMDKRGVAA